MYVERNNQLKAISSRITLQFSNVIFVFLFRNDFNMLLEKY